MGWESSHGYDQRENSVAAGICGNHCASVGRWQALKKLAARREAYMFASPALFLIVLFVIFPLIYSFYLTFHNYDLAIGPPADYVGLDNYREMFEDKRFWRSWMNTFHHHLPGHYPAALLGLGIALLLNRPIRVAGVRQLADHSLYGVASFRRHGVAHAAGGQVWRGE